MNFPDERILTIFKEPWYADIINYLVTRQLSTEWMKQNKYQFFTQVQYFFWEEPYLFKYRPNQIIQRCIPEEKQRSVLNFYHEFACGGYFGPHKTSEKVLQSGFYSLTLFKDSFQFYKSCVNCQKIEKILRQDMMPLNSIPEVKIFDVWCINFMGP